MSWSDEHVFSGSESTATISSIPATFDTLLIEIIAKTQQAVTNNTLGLRFNGDTTATYSAERLAGVGSSATGFPSIPGAPSYLYLDMPGASSGTSFPSTHIIRVPQYAGTTFPKIGGVSGNLLNGTGAGNHFTYRYTHWWDDTSAIASVTLYTITGDNFVAQCRLKVSAF